MSKSLVFLVLPLAFAFSTLHAAVDPNTLIKVNSDVKNKCVEYYNIEGDLYCSTTVQMTKAIDPEIKTYEKQKIIFDNRPWFAAWGNKTPNTTIVEYIPDGDDINSWNELITSQFMPITDDGVTPRKIADTFIENFKKSGFNPIVKIFSEDEDAILFEFRIESPDNQKQDELQLIRKGDDGYYFLHYVIKKSDMGEENRNKWLELMEKSTIPES